MSLLEHFQATEIPIFGASKQEQEIRQEAAAYHIERMRTLDAKARDLRRQAQEAEDSAFSHATLSASHLVRVGLPTAAYNCLLRGVRDGMIQTQSRDTHGEVVHSVDFLVDLAEWIVQHSDEDLAKMRNLGVKGRERVRAWAHWYLDQVEAWRKKHDGTHASEVD